jgi:hypothetical protein
LSDLISSPDLNISSDLISLPNSSPDPNIDIYNEEDLYCNGFEFNSAFKKFPMYSISCKDTTIRPWRLDIEASRLHHVNCYNNKYKLR